MIPPVQESERKSAKTEIDYVRVINKALPEDIRVLAWAPIAPEFDARFSAKSRTYRYYFLRDGMDVDLMAQALNNLVGEHDFRNFCKIDVEGTKTWTRRVIEVELTRVEGEVMMARIKGSAFLWHQIRFIMAIVFLVGKRLEKPDIVTKLLNVEDITGRPEYTMASDVPLVLQQCDFGEEEPQWRGGEGREGISNEFSLYSAIYRLYEEYTLKAAVLRGMLGDVNPTQEMTQERKRLDVAFAGGNYVPLLQRPRLATIEARQDQQAKKKEQKGQ